MHHTLLIGRVGNGYPVADSVSCAEGLVRAFTTGEFRASRKGEWYISGVEPAAYRAANDFTPESCYYIAKLYRVRRITRYEIVGAVKES